MILTPEFLLIAAGAAAGGFVNGLAGFGTALFAMGFFLSVLPPVQAVALTVAVATVTGIQGLWVVRDSMLSHPARFLRFLLPALVGIPIGLELLKLLTPRDLKLIIAGMMILYGGYFSLRRALPQITRPLYHVDIGVGFLGGILGGAAGLSGALPTMWCALRGWPKSETRAVLQPFNLSILALTALILGFRGVYQGQILWMLAVALPVSMVAAIAGIALFKRLSDGLFRRVLIWLCFASGAVLLIEQLL